jgi:hypothetical protein
MRRSSRPLLWIAGFLSLVACRTRRVDAVPDATPPAPAPAATLHWLEAKDAARAPELVAGIAPDDGAAPEIRVDQGVLGLRTKGKTLWLTENEHEGPFQELAIFSATTYADTAKYRFLYVDGEHPFVDILDRNGKRAARYPIDAGLRIDRVVAHGTQAVLGPSAVAVARVRRPAQNFVCDLFKGCSELAPKAYPLAMHADHVLFAPSSSFDPPFVYDLKSGRRTELARPCQLAIGFVPRKGAMHSVCVGDETLMELDEAGAVVSRSPFPLDASAWQAGIVGEYLVYLRRPPGALSRQWSIAKPDGTVAATLFDSEAGAIALFPDGTFESFGDVDGLSRRLTCETGGTLRPLEACQRALRVSGRLQRLLESTSK